MYTCCICKEACEGFGNNPDGAIARDFDGSIIGFDFNDDDRCCDICNQKYVIPGRLYRIHYQTDNKKAAE